MKWNSDDTDCLITMRENNWEVSAIANEMGYSKSTIEYWIKKLGLLRNKKWTEEEDEQLKELTIASHSIQECAGILNRSIDNIKHRRMDLGVTGLGWRKVRPEEGDSYKYSQKPDKLTKVYLIEFDGFYKVGTTQQTITQRFGGRYPQYEVLLIIETTLEEALDIEREWLENVKHLKYVPNCFPAEGRGFTECFKI